MFFVLGTFPLTGFKKKKSLAYDSLLLNCVAFILYQSLDNTCFHTAVEERESVPGDFFSQSAVILHCRFFANSALYLKKKFARLEVSPPCCR
jgi:hypothetical protein